jgi:hypothetical protein
MSRGKILKAASNGHSSSEELLPSCINSESSLNRLPSALTSFDPHEFNPGELLQRFRARRSRNRSHERRSSAPSVESVEPVMEEKFSCGDFEYEIRMVNLRGIFFLLERWGWSERLVIHSFKKAT